MTTMNDDEFPLSVAASSLWPPEHNITLINVKALEDLGRTYAARRDGCRRTAQAHGAPPHTLHKTMDAALANAQADTWECARAELAALLGKSDSYAKG